VAACPYEARVIDRIEEQRETVPITVNHELHLVPARISVVKALELIGFKPIIFKEASMGDTELLVPCRTGGCWSCAVVINGQLRPSCITPVEAGMEIVTDHTVLVNETPKRLVSGFQGHAVGGVGTPYWLKPRAWGSRNIEVACFAHGCILRCPTCQNWQLTYSAAEEPLTPEETARLLTYERRRHGVDRMAISGGECTLNRRWLLNYLQALKRLNRDEKARLHVDTNAVVLTADYIDALYQAGATDIGADVKGLDLETFVRISGLKDRELATNLLRTEWQAVKYLIDEYSDKLFVGIGIPYNETLISLEEIRRIGDRIASWSPEIQVSALDYRPAFRSRDIRKPLHTEMRVVKRVLEESGLRCVICQTELGMIGP